MRQYKFNIDMDPDRLSLQAMEKDSKETIREYTQRWREAALQVNPYLLEKGDDQLVCQHFQGPVL
jgi:hypothetical protein